MQGYLAHKAAHPSRTLKRPFPSSTTSDPNQLISVTRASLFHYIGPYGTKSLGTNNCLRGSIDGSYTKKVYI